MPGFRQVIDGPAFTALPNYLWDAAQHPSPGGPHWQQGVTWSEWCGGGSTVMDECVAVTGSGAPSAQSTLASTVSQVNRGATAFTVFAEFDCSPVGQDAEMNQAAEALARTENYQITKAFWTGKAGTTAGPTSTTTVFPHLSANTVVTDPNGITLQTAASQSVTGGDDAAVALGVLEYNLASCYGGEGVIHIPYLALPTFVARALVRRDDATGKYYTAAGNCVVPGQGYDGSSPSGAAPAAGTSWIYATGPLFAFRSDVFVQPFPGTFDRAENTVRKMAYRTYLFGFGCCHLAALTTLGVPT